jgi:transcriptional regulator with XRE-family HTH domain
LSQEAVAHLVGRSEGWLIQVENGRSDPGYADLLELASVLQIDLVQLVSDRAEATAGYADADGVGQESQERLRRVVSGPVRADMQVVDQLHRLLADWRILDDLLGPRALLPLTQPVCDLLDQLSQDADPPVRNALLTCGAEYQQFMGWLWVDLGDHRQAGISYERAIARAVQGDRDELAGYLLACQAEHGIVDNRPSLARSLAEAAQARRRALTPAVIGWAADLEARTWAAQGDESQCRRKLAEARELLRISAETGRAGEPPWIYHFVPDAFLVHEGMCMAELGQAQPAIESLGVTIAALEPGRVRDRAYYLSYLAKAHSSAADPEQAARVGHEALTLAVQCGSRRIIARLDAVGGGLRRWRNVSAVRDFSEALGLVRAQ